MPRMFPRIAKRTAAAGLVLLRLYPFGYYALLAAWIRAVQICHGGITGLFFGARLLSVALLAVSLLLTYVTARELRLGRALALAVTALIGFLPLTSFMSSYI